MRKCDLHFKCTQFASDSRNVLEARAASVSNRQCDGEQLYFIFIFYHFDPIFTLSGTFLKSSNTGYRLPIGILFILLGIFLCQIEQDTPWLAVPSHLVCKGNLSAVQ